MTYRETRDRIASIDKLQKEDKGNIPDQLIEMGCFSEEKYTAYQHTIDAHLHLGDELVLPLPSLIPAIFYHSSRLYQDPSYTVALNKYGPISKRDAALTDAALSVLTDLLNENIRTMEAMLCFSFPTLNEAHSVTTHYQLVGAYVWRALCSISNSAKTQSEPLTFRQRLLLSSGVSFGQNMGYGATIPTAPIQDSDMAPYFLPARMIPFATLLKKTPSQVRQWIAQEPVNSLIPFHFESVLRFVADRLAPSVSERLTDRGSLSALLVAFDINRQALRESGKSPIIDMEFLDLPVQAIEDLICYLHRKDAQRNSEPRKGKAFEALPETPPFPIDELNSYDPLLERQIQKFICYDPDHVFTLLEEAVTYALEKDQKALAEV